MIRFYRIVNRKIESVFKKIKSYNRIIVKSNFLLKIKNKIENRKLTKRWT
jgi:uncharacterized C2H2 Zn-finger protein